MSKKRQSLSEQLRAAILNSGKTPYAISQATGVEQSSLSRFIKHDKHLRLDTASLIAEFLGLTLKPE